MLWMKWLHWVGLIKTVSWRRYLDSLGTWVPFWSIQVPTPHNILWESPFSWTVGVPGSARPWPRICPCKTRALLVKRGCHPKPTTGVYICFFPLSLQLATLGPIKFTLQISQHSWVLLVWWEQCYWGILKQEEEAPVLEEFRLVGRKY